MRRYYVFPVLVFLLIALLLSLSALPASAAPLDITLSQLRNKVDNWLAPRWQVVQERQDQYFNAHGRYWQGLRTHTFDLEYTDVFDAESPADALEMSPTDQQERWTDIFPEFVDTPIPAVIVIDVYDGPQGQGYVANLYVKWNGNVYHRAAQVGPEDWRAAGWHKIEVNR